MVLYQSEPLQNMPSQPKKTASSKWRQVKQGKNKTRKPINVNQQAKLTSCPVKDPKLQTAPGICAQARPKLPQTPANTGWEGLWPLQLHRDPAKMSCFLLS